eukprot:gene1062-499_t
MMEYPQYPRYWFAPNDFSKGSVGIVFRSEEDRDLVWEQRDDDERLEVGKGYVIFRKCTSDNGIQCTWGSSVSVERGDLKKAVRKILRFWFEGNFSMNKVGVMFHHIEDFNTVWRRRLFKSGKECLAVGSSVINISKCSNADNGFFCSWTGSISKQQVICALNVILKEADDIVFAAETLTKFVTDALPDLTTSNRVYSFYRNHSKLLKIIGKDPGSLDNFIKRSCPQLELFANGLGQLEFIRVVKRPPSVSEPSPMKSCSLRKPTLPTVQDEDMLSAQKSAISTPTEEVTVDTKATLPASPVVSQKSVPGETEEVVVYGLEEVEKSTLSEPGKVTEDMDARPTPTRRRLSSSDSLSNSLLLGLPSKRTPSVVSLSSNDCQELPSNLKDIPKQSQTSTPIASPTVSRRQRVTSAAQKDRRDDYQSADTIIRTTSLSDTGKGGRSPRR